MIFTIRQKNGTCRIPAICCIESLEKVDFRAKVRYWQGPVTGDRKLLISWYPLSLKIFLKIYKIQKRKSESLALSGKQLRRAYRSF